MKNYIIGYGSLFNKSSLQRTLPQVNEIIPINLNHYKRSWDAIENVTTTFSTTFLGVEKSHEHKINAIIFEIEEDMLATIDKREFLYTRKSLDFNDIELLSKTITLSPKDKIWIYITNTPSQPTQKNPIIQSYVDTCISGCFEIEKDFSLEGFAEEFILSTQNWSQYWINDRIFPRAPHIHRPDAYRIDALLSKTIHKYFSKIEIE